MTALAWVLAAFDGQAAERKVPRTKAEVQLSFAPLVKKAAPAVVNIYARKVVQGRRSLPLFDDPFFRRFFGEDFGFRQPQKQQQNSLGSGVIVRPDGLIVTNKHVIEGADQINVVLADRREFAATTVLTDDRTDLAILKVEAGKDSLPVMALIALWPAKWRQIMDPLAERWRSRPADL